MAQTRTYNSLTGNLGDLKVDLTLRNALDTKYTSFLSRYKTYALDPGRNLSLRLSTEF